MYFQRLIEKKIKKSLQQFPISLITGPRQAGKSTFLKNFLPDYTYITLDDPLNRRLAVEDPVLFLSQYNTPVIIDEVQNAPEIFPYLKMLIDQNRRKMGQFVLTGSQTFQLMEGVNESLAGRIAIFHLYPFSWQEIDLIQGLEGSSLNDLFCINQILRGFYPEFLVNKDLDLNIWHGSYITTYIERDIRKIRSITDLSRFQTFVALLATRAGKLLNLSEVAKECGISQPTAKDWVSVLESTYVIHLLHPYHNNASKRLIKSPKLYFVDTGILCYLLGIDTHDRFMRSPDRAAIFENMVIMEALKRISTEDPHVRCFFYRTTSGVEVDLVCDHQNNIRAYEIKFSKSPSKEMIKSLTLFKKDYPNAELALLSLHDKSIPLTREVKALHWSSLLSNHPF